MRWLTWCTFKLSHNGLGSNLTGDNGMSDTCRLSCEWIPQSNQDNSHGRAHCLLVCHYGPERSIREQGYHLTIYSVSNNADCTPITLSLFADRIQCHYYSLAAVWHHRWVAVRKSTYRCSGMIRHNFAAVKLSTIRTRCDVPKCASPQIDRLRPLTKRARFSSLSPENKSRFGAHANMLVGWIAELFCWIWC